MMVSLAGLLTIDIVLLTALFAQVDPHPPGSLGPFIGTMISLGVVSALLVSWGRRVGLAASAIFGGVNILAVGPQKLVFDVNGEEVAPIVIFGTVLIGILFYSVALVQKKDVPPTPYE